LKKGKFLKSLKQNCIYDSYLKYLPSDTSEQENLIIELKKNQLDLQDYQYINKNSSLSPDGTIITAEGIDALAKQNIRFMPLDNHQQLRFTSMNANSTGIKYSLIMHAHLDTS
jgi:hypothetical protein